MPERSDGPNSFEDPEVGRGGADAVPGTPDVPGHGTEPEEPTHGMPTARAHPGGGVTRIGWIVAILILIVLLAYGFGLGR